MIGLLWPMSGPVQITKERLGPLTVLRATVPPDRRRGLVRACKRLSRKGVRRVLVHRQLEDRSLSHGLVAVDPGPLYRHLAPNLALAALAAGDHSPDRAVVVLRSRETGGALCRTARLLCPRVAQVRIEAESGSDRVQEWLLRTFGMAADPNAPATLTLRLDGPDGGEDLYLDGPGARLGPVSLEGPGTEGVEEVDRHCLLCAFWQAGALFSENIGVKLLDK